MTDNEILKAMSDLLNPVIVDLSEIKSKIVVVDEKIGSLENKMDALDERVGSLENKMDALTATTVKFWSFMLISARQMKA